MNILKNLFLINKESGNIKVLNQEGIDQYGEIGQLVKEARLQKNITIQELSQISKIPARTINSIENNNKDTIPKSPFLRSILIKLEECLAFKKNTLVKLAIREKDILEKEKKDFILSKFDLINTWQGTLLYFLMLILTIFILKRFFIINVNVIEIQNIENQNIEQ